VLFMRTKHQAKKLAKQLTMDGIPAVDLHGNLAQAARERNLEAFSSGSVRVLVATDIAARGIHVDDIELVVHVDPPAEHKAYLHRSGRTARAGSGGDVVTVILPEQRGDVRQLTRAAKITATPKPVNAGDATLTKLVGEQAAPVRYVAPPVTQQSSGGGGRRGSGRGNGSSRQASAAAGSGTTSGGQRHRQAPAAAGSAAGAPSGQRRRRGGSGRGGSGGGSGASSSGGPRVVYSRG
jgi:superfamily II DNA/RNA helicase